MFEQFAFPGFELAAAQPLIYDQASSFTTPAQLPAQTPIAVATAAYTKANRATWPRVPVTLWDRSFSQQQRAEMNLAAMTLANSLPKGQKPTDAERDTLNLFNGWGALSDMFSNTAPTGLSAIRDELQAIVGADGLKTIREATTTSFFTPPAVVRALWSGMEAMGFKGGKILEPSAGHGLFLGQMPEAMARQSQITAIEPDKATCSVLRALYEPYGVNVVEGTFESFQSPDGFFDAVVTNVPFGDFGVPELRNVPYRNFRIHDYFLARAMDVVRPGGLVVVITSAGSMDKTSSKVRSFLGTNANLIGAFRLPVEAFQDFAGTEPTTDVLVFQRHDQVVAPNASEWCDVASYKPSHFHTFPYSYTSRNNGLMVNEWFKTHTDDVLGKLEVRSTQYGYAHCVVADGDWLSRLEQRMMLLPNNLYSPAARTRTRAIINLDEATELQPGSFMVAAAGGVCTVVTRSTVVPVAANATTVQRIVGMIAIRDAARSLLFAQVDTNIDDDPKVLAHRVALNEAYDTFVRRYGALNASANTRAFLGDPAAMLLQSIEVQKADGSFGKADIFTRRTVNARYVVTQCDSASDALKASLAVRGGVDAQWIAELTGRDGGEVMQELAEQGVVYTDPRTFAWVEAGEYLSGNVRQKLREAELSGDAFSANADALRGIVPADLLPSDIHAALGATWIPIDDYESFLKEFLGSKNGNVMFDAITGTWSVTGAEWEIPQHLQNDFGVTGYLSPIDMMGKSMNRQQPTITDADPTDSKKRVVNQAKTIEAREKQSNLDAQFIEWLWSDVDRTNRLARQYNDSFNSVVNRKFDGSHLVLPGFSQCYKLHPHQKNAIWRVVTQATNCLLAHKVGFGKSLEMVASGMEIKRLGIASKIAYVVPNATLGDFVTEFVKAYPAANLLVATEKDFAGDNRRLFLARAATGNWDGVVIAHSSFERIRLGQAFTEGFIEREIELIEAAIRLADDKRSQSVKQLERAKRQWEARLSKMANAKGDAKDVLSFDEIGFDWLMVDEAHYFKNLYRFSKMERVAGLPDSNSERAFDMYLKCRAVIAKHEGTRGVVFATGTPVANSIGELFIMQRFLQELTLGNLGMASFDAWASNFGEVVTGLEIAPDGSGYRMNRRFARFVNIPELMSIFREVADIQVGNPPCLKLPTIIREIIPAKASPELKSLVKELVLRAEKIRNGLVKPQEDNMLAVTGDGRKAALDMRLLSRSYDDTPYGKVNLCVENVVSIWKDTVDQRLTQAIFSDLGTPTGKSFSVYDDIKTKLISAGVPEAEIAFAHDAETHAARAKLAQDVRAGRIRIVIGSTQKLGVGVNIQTRLIAIHHLDAPWRPADIEQRDGRIERQGNMNEVVRIYRYVTEGSFDAYMWQTLETKAKFIAQIMTGETTVRTAEDLEMAALSYAEVKALASGNPMVIEKAGVDAEVAKLCVMKAAHADAVARAKRNIVEYPNRIAAVTRRRDGVQSVATALAAFTQPELAANGQVLSNVPNIGRYIHDVATGSQFIGARSALVGTVADLQLTVTKSLFGSGYVIHLGDAVCSLSEQYTGEAIAASNAFVRLVNNAEIEKLVEALDNQLVVYSRNLEESRSEAVKLFAQDARLREVLARQTEINNALGKSDSVVGEAEAA